MGPAIDYGKPCSDADQNGCTLHNLHCGYPKCAKGRADLDVRRAQAREMTDEDWRAILGDTAAMSEG